MRSIFVRSLISEVVAIVVYRVMKQVYVSFGSLVEGTYVTLS